MIPVPGVTAAAWPAAFSLPRGPELNRDRSPRRRKQYSCSRNHRPPTVNIQRVNGGTGAHEQPVLLRPTKAKIGAAFRKMDLADQRSIGRVTARAVLGRIAPTHRAPDVAVDIATQPVRHAGCEIVGEDASVAQACPIHI